MSLNALLLAIAPNISIAVTHINAVSWLYILYNRYNLIYTKLTLTPDLTCVYWVEMKIRIALCSDSGTKQESL
jgi:hypothetical protein